MCKSLHRSAFSHFERLQFEGECHKEKRQTLAQTTVGEFCEISQLFRKEMINRKLRRRQRQKRFEKKLEVEMLNQVASKLKDIASGKAERRMHVGKKYNFLRKGMHVSKDFESEYLGDTSIVSSIMINNMQFHSNNCS